MGKVCDALFTDTPLESAADMLAGDPDYELWSDKVNEQFNDTFKTSEDSAGASCAKGSDKQVRKVQVPELRGHSGSGKTPPF